jgi:hypothetical protein
VAEDLDVLMLKTSASNGRFFLFGGRNLVGRIPGVRNRSCSLAWAEGLVTCDRVQHCQRVRLRLRICEESRADIEAS